MKMLIGVLSDSDNTDAKELGEIEFKMGEDQVFITFPDSDRTFGVHPREFIQMLTVAKENSYVINTRRNK